MTLLRNYLTVAFRMLARQKLYSAIKIGGFAASIAACLLISLYIQQELNYDQHYTHGDRMYRLLRRSALRGEAGVGVHFPAPLARTLQAEYPALEKTGHYNAAFETKDNQVRRSDQLESLHEEGFVHVNQELLDILELPFVAGNPRKALAEPGTLVITQRKAEKYFPREDPIGKVLVLNNDPQRQYRVTGVIRDFPATSHLQFDFLMSLAGKEFWPGEQTDWRASNYINYVRVRPGTDITQLEKQLSATVHKYFMPYAVGKGANTEEIGWLKSFRFELQPVGEIYLNRVQVRDDLPHGDLRYIWLFGSVAVFILLIASINFINLSTARSANRAKEVGIRKVIGSRRGSLIEQFLAESLLYSFFAFAVGVLLACLLLPYFNGLVGKSLAFPWQNWWLLPLLAAGAGGVGLLAGLYPAFYLSAFQPIRVLKGNVSRGSKAASIRSVLVVFQFSVSVVLILGTLVIGRQMHFIHNKKLGFDKEQVLLLEGTHTLGEKIAAFKQQLQGLPQVRHVSVSNYLPLAGRRRDNGPMWTQGMADAEKISSQHWNVDHDYLKTMGLKLVQGRDFSAQMLTDSGAVIINQSLAEALQLKKPVGERIFNWRGGWTVIGVVEDFHFESLKERIQPMGLFLGRSTNTLLLKVQATDMTATLQGVTRVWKQFSPHQPIRYAFLDQQYAAMYADVERTGRIFSSFTLLAIVVACLGLFALSAFMIEQRGKEISIRKVLGASLGHLVGLLTFNFVKLVLIAFTLAVPVAWYLMHEWLKDFVYRIPLAWELFGLAGLSAVAVALLTIGYQSLKAALANPVRHLKAE
jgi:putative ABC transport system permease protein